MPDRLKYTAFLANRRRQLPYRLLADGSVAVQVGAPFDTLKSGRSRGFSFAVLTAPRGRTIIVEPEARSGREFRAFASGRGFDHVEVHTMAASDTVGEFELWVDESHPATNFLDGRIDADDEMRNRYEIQQVAARPLADVLDESVVDHVDVLSITTNGAELEIMRGVERWLPRIRYIAMACTGEDTGDDLEGMLRDAGFSFVGHDDRGFTYENENYRG